nr:RNA-directed DNA polymerase, eukaryota [Tanacetum cinerariifolium]
MSFSRADEMFVSVIWLGNLNLQPWQMYVEWPIVLGGAIIIFAANVSHMVTKQQVTGGKSCGGDDGDAGDVVRVLLDGSLWYRVIQALYGASFELQHVNQSSIWCSILREMQVLISKGFDFVSHCKKRVGDGHNTRLWYDSWVFDQPLRVRFPRLFALETDKVSAWDDLNSVSGSVTLSASKDKWICDLNGDGVFRVKENLVRRGVVLDSSLCSLCGLVPEDIHHVLFRCDTAKLVFRRVCRWWDLDWHDLLSFSDWNAWFSAIRLSSRIKLILEGVFYVAWWHFWVYRNQSVFAAPPPRRSVIFNDIVSRSFT